MLPLVKRLFGGVVESLDLIEVSMEAFVADAFVVFRGRNVAQNEQCATHVLENSRKQRIGVHNNQLWDTKGDKEVGETRDGQRLGGDRFFRYKSGVCKACESVDERENRMFPRFFGYIARLHVERSIAGEVVEYGLGLVRRVVGKPAMRAVADRVKGVAVHAGPPKLGG